MYDIIHECMGRFMDSEMIGRLNAYVARCMIRNWLASQMIR